MLTVYTLHSDVLAPTPYVRNFTERTAAMMHIDHLCGKFDKEYGSQGNSEFTVHRFDPATNDRLCLAVEMRIETAGDTDIVENLSLFEEPFSGYEKTAQS